jgi:hypothetical protein
MRILLTTLFLALFSAESVAAGCLTGDCNRTGSGFAICSLALEKLPTTDACVVGHAAYFVAYVDGVFDSLIKRQVVCPPAEATRDQGRAVVKKYLQENPDRWHSHIYDITSDALLRAFPCSANSGSR